MSGSTLYVGSYAQGGGEGLYRLSYDPAQGFALSEAVPAATNASYGVWSPERELLYLVDEQAVGALGAYRRSADGWIQAARVSTEGREPCYVAIDPAGARIAVANYGSGSIGLFDLGPDGVPSAAGAYWSNRGGGPNEARQDGPHLHCVQFSANGRFLYGVDLGTDQIVRFDLNDATPLETATVAWQAPPGSGPRHLLFHPREPIALLVSELASTLTWFDVSGEDLAPRVACSTLPDGFAGESLGGHLALNAAGDRVYVTNRGHDSVAVFRLEPDGTLELLQHVPSGGASPRFFLLLHDLRRLLLVNEESANVVAFAINDDGTIAPSGQAIDVPGAAFLVCTP